MLIQDYGVDCIAYNESGLPLVLAEAKNKMGTTPEWAAGLRRNILYHRQLPEAKYFLVITPEHMFLWVGQAGIGSNDLPQHVMDARVALRSHLKNLTLEPGYVGAEAFQMVAGAWLRDFSDGRDVEGWPPEFVADLRTARVETHLA
jgi:hypothetical protein